MRRLVAPVAALSLSLAPALATAQTGQPAAPSTRATGGAPEPSPTTTEAREATAAETGRTEPTPAPTNLLDRVGQMFVLHGYLRVRPELMADFDLGWANPALSATAYARGNLPWIRNLDALIQNLCSTDPAPGTTMRTPGNCTGSTQTMANMRLRVNPEIHVTDNIAIHAQIDILDNLILGSTPQGYYARAGAAVSPWAPVTAFSQTQVPPTEQNSLVPSIMVSRAWAEVTNPTLGQIRFGRMPGQWGLGILANAGNGIDSDYQTHTDRLMYALRIRSIGLFAAAFYDFASTGATTQSVRYEPGQGQPIDVSMLDDVRQYGFAVGHREDPAESRRRLSRGSIVWNGGLYALYRHQLLSGELSVDTAGDPRTVGTSSSYANSTLRRSAQAGIFDLWFQLLHRNFRLEAEAAFIYGNLAIGTTPGDPGARTYEIAQFGGAVEFEYRLLNNRLSLEFKAGFATGDPDVEGLNYHNAQLAPIRAQARALTTFRFNPDYRIDLILWRQIFRQVSGAYYFRPAVTYAFVDRPGGDRFYGRAAVIWSRASEFVQTTGNAADLGSEINAEVTYMSNYRDQTFGAAPAPGFFASLQYGVLFPMAGLGPMESLRSAGGEFSSFSFSTAQTLRGVVGVMY
ncbi:MAG: TIGR04551 family protein [Polyangiales bacterium]